MTAPGTDRRTAAEIVFSGARLVPGPPSSAAGFWLFTTNVGFGATSTGAGPKGAGGSGSGLPEVWMYQFRRYSGPIPNSILLISSTLMPSSPLIFVRG